MKIGIGVGIMMIASTTLPRVEITVISNIEIGFLDTVKIIGRDSMGIMTDKLVVHYTGIISQVRGGLGVGMSMIITVFMTETHSEKLHTIQALIYLSPADSHHWETFKGGE